MIKIKAFYQEHKIGFYIVGVLAVMALVATIILNGDTSAIQIND